AISITSNELSISGSSHLGPGCTSSGRRIVSTIAAITAPAIGQRGSATTPSSPSGSAPDTTAAPGKPCHGESAREPERRKADGVRQGQAVEHDAHDEPDEQS